MKRAAFAFLTLSITLLACARNISQVTDPTLTLTVDGLERSYILHVPDSYDGRQPVPLILDFHGGGGNATNQQRVSNFANHPKP